MSSDGTLLGSTYESTSTGINTTSLPPRVSSNGSDYALVFAITIASTYSLNYSIIDGSTGTAEPESVSVGATYSAAAPRWNGSQWLTVTRNTAADQVQARTFLDEWSTSSRLDTEAGSASSGFLVPAASGYAALWQEPGTIDNNFHFRSLDTTGSPTSTPVHVAPIEGSSGSLEAAKRTARGIEVWVARGATHDRYLLDDSGTVLDSQTIAPPNTGFLDRLGAEFTYVYTDGEGLWLQRFESL